MFLLGPERESQQGRFERQWRKNKMFPLAHYRIQPVPHVSYTYIVSLDLTAICRGQFYHSQSPHEKIEVQRNLMTCLGPLDSGFEWVPVSG